MTCKALKKGGTATSEELERVDKENRHAFSELVIAALEKNRPLTNLHGRLDSVKAQGVGTALITSYFTTVVIMRMDGND